MPKMKKGVEGLHATENSEMSAAPEKDETVEAPRPVKDTPKASAPPMPPPGEKISYSELSPAIRAALIQIHKDRGVRPDWPNTKAAMQDCLIRIQRNWSGFLSDVQG